MLAAAFPRASWRTESEAVYTMALTAEGVPASVARAAIAELIREEMELPPVALLLRRCRLIDVIEHDWQCPECGSHLICGTAGGPGICGDCEWEGTLP